MTDTLRDVLHAEPFAAVRTFDDLARFHVWHGRLGVKEPADDAVRAALARGRGIALVGAPGSGKTSTFAAAALDQEGVGRSHLPLPLSAMGTDVETRVSDPRYLAERLVRGVARINEEAARLVDDATAGGTVTRAAATWKAQLGGRYSHVAKEMRQRTEAVDFERSPAEVLDAARAALEVAAANDIRLVVLLEDADGLLRLPGQSPADRHATANAFFLDGLAPLIRELAVPFLVAVQPDYRHLDGFRTASQLLGSVVDAPAPSDFTDPGLRLLLSESLRTAGIERQLTDLFDGAALERLAEERYAVSTIRSLLQVCDRAVAHASMLDHPVVEAADVLYALTQD